MFDCVIGIHIFLHYDPYSKGGSCHMYSEIYIWTLSKWYKTTELLLRLALQSMYFLITVSKMKKKWLHDYILFAMVDW